MNELWLWRLNVSAEKFTEIDENGDEVEVKRFYIEGRQLNDGNRQCVETRRRKRSSYYGEANKDDALPIASFTAPTGIDTADSKDEDDDESADQPVAVFGVFNGREKKKKQSIAVANGAGDEDDEGGEGPILSLPVVAQLTHGNGAQSTVGAASAGSNGIVIVHANTPPKVNSQTHGIFELRPVHSENSFIEGFANEGEDYDDLAYEEEVNPVSTTAIWSTGDDNPTPYSHIDADYEDNYDKDNFEENEDQTPIDTPPLKPRPRPTQKPKRKPSKTANKKRPKKSKAKRRKQSSSYHHKTAKRRKNQNLQNRDIKRNQLNRLHNVNKGSNSFTKTETFTKTGTPNDQKDVNCIIINRTTTQRPFWGLFGRNAAGDVVQEDKPYGRRKRINFSIPA